MAGLDPAVVEDLPIHEKWEVVKALECGRLGWKKDAFNTYVIISYIHNLQNVVVKALGGETSPMVEFDEIFGSPDEREQIRLRKIVEALEKG